MRAFAIGVLAMIVLSGASIFVLRALNEPTVAQSRELRSVVLNP